MQKYYLLVFWQNITFRLTRYLDAGKAEAVEKVLKYWIFDIELTEKNLVPCIFIAYTTKQNAVKEGLVFNSRYKEI